MQESGLDFQFDARWRVEKYDETDYYQALSGRGFSAVDFVGLWCDEVVFIEVKNYRNRPADQLERTREKIEGETPPLVQIFDEKVWETLEGIELIGKALRRRWWYRQYYKLLSYPALKARLLRSKRLFWMYVDEKIQTDTSAVRLVLWMELPDALATERANVATALKRQLEADFQQIEMASQAQHPFGDSLSVKSME